MLQIGVQSESGTAIYKNTNDKTIKINGEGFNNIAKTISLPMSDEKYVNYYQNKALVTTNSKVYVKKLIASNNKVTQVSHQKKH